jgi:cyclopropane-fatty-acyl-phospholipid synthase
MPQNPAAWSAWNFLGSNNDKVCVTYWLNILQVGNIAVIKNAFFIAIYHVYKVGD